jgi:DNA repair exonuclease SbcCD nuclease subunit
MKIAHLADIHLGFQRFAGSRSTVRKYDVFNSFRTAVVQCIEERVDAVVIAGDLFDTPDPDNETLLFAIQMLTWLRDEGKEVVIASGNHETPKSSRTHVFSILADIGLHAIHDETAVLDLDCGRFVVVPWMFKQLNWEEIPAGDYLVIHTAAMKSPGMASSFRVWPKDMEMKWDYVALGDWHKRVNIQPEHNVWYPGAIERFSFGEQDEKCGMLFYMSQLEGGAEFVEVPYAWDAPAREMITLDIDLGELEDPDRDVNVLLEQHSKACVRLRLSGTPTLLDPRTIEWHNLLQLEYVGGDATSGPQYAPSDALGDWTDYCAYTEEDKAVRRYGRAYVREFM